MQVSAIKQILSLFLLAVVTFIVPTMANAESGKYQSAINRFKKAPEVDSFFIQALVHHRQLAGLGLPFLGKGMQPLPLCQDICTNKQHKLS